MDTSWPTLVLDIGYAFTSSVDECKNHFSKICVREVSPQDVAKIISLMCRTHKNLSDLSVNLPNPSTFWPSQKSIEKDGNAVGSKESQTWNPEVFVQTISEIAPTTNWKDVCFALDHADFIIKDRAALVLLMTIVRLGMQASGAGQNFPAECLYRHWANIEGQLSLISMILKNSDVYSFSDYVFTGVPIDVFKSPPDTENKEIASWKSLHLVEVLLYIAENGLIAPVMELFKTPIQHCPDLLFMALLQINPPLTLMRQELFSTLIPIFLGNHPNSATILHHGWNSANLNPSLRHIIMHAMSEWYLRGENDQTRLTRILDVAQDLKALSNLLNVRSFSFVIDLACLASRREYLKLDKWLTDKIREHGEPFVQVIIKFLQRRCPQIMGPKLVDDPIPKVAQLPNETLSTILTCLQACINNVQQDLADLILTMTAHGNLLLNKQRSQQVQQQVNTVRPHRGVMEQSFSSSSLGNHLFSAPPNDALNALSSNLTGLNLGNPGNGSFAFNILGNMAPKSNSPSRILQSQSASPFPVMSMPNIPTVGNLGRLAGAGVPIQPGDKLNITNNQSAFPDMPQNLSKEVEDEANSYFQRIYNHPPHATLAIDEVLDMLQRFQESQIRREREVSQCMLRNLFEEYRFFPQYPDKELQITAQLFGGMIERNLVTTYVALGLALRCVLDALRKPEGSKMYFFGITALDRFKTKLLSYQKYCEHVRSIPHFSEFPAHLIEFVEYGIQGQEPPIKPQVPVIGLTNILPSPNLLFRSNSVTSNITSNKNAVIANPAAGLAPRNLKSIANATNINTLLVASVDREEKISLPPDTVQDKIAFIFNNLSQLNLQTKCEELKEIINKDYWPWLSQYLVLKRASIELNFHLLYSNFLDALKIPEIVKLVTKETFRNIRVLLHSDKGIENFSDRSLLKSLGHWLGMMTLARNKPILHIDLDLKLLLMEAYLKGQQELLYVVPFVAKIVESCAKSKVFKPPNPWTMAIMNVLGELHQEPELKLNLKFEIEVLCKTLSMDIHSLKPTIYLRDSERAQIIENQFSQLNPQPQKSKQMFHDTSPQQVVGSQSVLDEPRESLSVGGNVTASPSQSAETTIANSPPEPRYNYMDIVIGNISNLSQHIVLSPTVTMLHAHPQLKQYVKTAIERTITDWVTPVVDRSVRIAVNTCEQIIRKDFALEPDENRMRTAAHYMVRNLTAGMAMITCRDQLLASISGNIKTALAASNTLPQPPELAEIAASQLASDNTELACAFIQKTAIEKAIPEIEKRLANDFELRKVARQEGRRYCDPSVLSYQTVRMPEHIRVKVGSVSNTNFSVYDEFARNIPGFQPISERDIELLTPKPETTTTALFTDTAVVSSNGSFFGSEEIWFLIEELATKIDSLISTVLSNPALQIQNTNMHGLLECLMIARRTRDNISGLNLLNKAVEGLMEGIVNDPDYLDQIKIYRDIHLRILHILQDARALGGVWTSRAITKCMIECREEIRYNADAVHLLISSNLVHISQYDTALAQLMDNGNNFLAVAFGMQLIQHYFVDTRPNPLINDNDFFNSIDLLMRISAHPRAPEGLAHLIELLHLSSYDPASLVLDRVNSGPTQHIHSGILQVRTNDYDDPPGFIEKVEYLLKDWVTIYHTQAIGRDPIKTFGMFVNKMNLYGILKTDDLITRFFRQATQLCIDLVYRNLNDSTATLSQTKVKVFNWIDAFVRLISLIVKHSGENGHSATKVNMLNKILGIIVGVLLQDQEQHGISFQQLGYHRLFIMLFLELSAPEPILENISLSIITAFCHTYHILRPSMAPGFCYSWLELISHRVFIGRILALIPQQKGWSMYSQLLLDLFRYLAPFLRNAELAKPVQLLYKGTLRVLLVLLHDFPEFLCDYHFGFCDIIPPNCIQMRNLILAAFPRNMRLPDPFTPNLKVDMLNEITTAPRIFTNYVANIQPHTLKKDLDSYLKARAPVTFLSELRGHLQVSNEPGSKYNVTLLNALVLYVGTQAIGHIRSKNLVPNMTTILHCSHMDILQNLIVDLDHEGRYLFLNVIANQLRYPNSHTHYFSCALLYLFAEANSEAIQEQITRVLLERLIVNRPHPWGLLITFIELIKNPVYKFWDHDFVHCAPEIEKLFESVARSCMVMKSNNLQLNQLAENEITD